MRKGYITAVILLIILLIRFIFGERVVVQHDTMHMPVDTIKKIELSPFVVLSPYDKHFRNAIDSLPGYDWKFLAAIAFTESRFDSTAKSGVGASGVMQVMPRTMQRMGIPDSMHMDTRTNIMAATSLLKSLDYIFRRIEDPDEKINFILASYNAGIGQVSDAMRLAQKYGHDRYKWKNSVDTFLILKGLPEYYNDSVCKTGEFNDWKQTLQFIKKVKNTWHRFKRRQESYSDSIHALVSKDSTYVIL